MRPANYESGKFGKCIHLVANVNLHTAINKRASEENQYLWNDLMAATCVVPPNGHNEWLISIPTKECEVFSPLTVDKFRQAAQVYIDFVASG